MFKVGDVIKHERFMDVALKVFRCVDMPNYYAVQGMWINQGQCDVSFDIGTADLVKIPKDQKGQWLRCVDQNANPSLRKCEWEVIP